MNELRVCLLELDIQYFLVPCRLLFILFLTPNSKDSLIDNREIFKMLLTHIKKPILININKLTRYWCKDILANFGAVTCLLLVKAFNQLHDIMTLFLVFGVGE